MGLDKMEVCLIFTNIVSPEVREQETSLDNTERWLKGGRIIEMISTAFLINAIKHLK